MEEARKIIEDLLVRSARILMFDTNEFMGELRKAWEWSPDVLVRSTLDDFITANADESVLEARGSRGVQNWLIDLRALLNAQEQAMLAYTEVFEKA